MPDAGMPDFPLGLTMGMILSTPMVVVGPGLIWRGLRAPAPATPPPSRMSLKERLEARRSRAGGPMTRRRLS